MDQYIPGIVYKNLEKFLEYRNVKSDQNFLTIEALRSRLDHYEYATIEGTSSDKSIFIVLIAPGSKYSNRSQDFKKLLSFLPKNKLPDSNLIFISDTEFTIHIKRQIAEVKKKYPGIYIEDYDYKKFMLVVPEHKSVPKHEILPNDNLQEVLGIPTEKAKLPKIRTSDPPVIWIGARPGDIVKITRISESAGINIAYRLVIK